MSCRFIRVVVAGFIWLVFGAGGSHAQSIIDGAKKEGRVVFYASMESTIGATAGCPVRKEVSIYKSRRDPHRLRANGHPSSR